MSVDKFGRQLPSRRDNDPVSIVHRGPLDGGGERIKRVHDPKEEDDAVNKRYVDGVLSNLESDLLDRTISSTAHEGEKVYTADKCRIIKVGTPLQTYNAANKMYVDDGLKNVNDSFNRKIAEEISNLHTAIDKKLADLLNDLTKEKLLDAMLNVKQTTIREVKQAIELDLSAISRTLGSHSAIIKALQDYSHSNYEYINRNVHPWLRLSNASSSEVPSFRQTQPPNN